MTGAFGDQDKNVGKRPAPTIEGTATEVSVDPSAEGNAAGASAAGEPKPGAPDEKTKRKAAPPHTSIAELRGFLTHLAAGLLGGLVGVVALAFAWNLIPPRTDQAQDVAALKGRLAKLEAAPPSDANAKASNAKALGTFEERIKTLEERKVEPADLSGVTARVTRLEDTLDALAKTASEGGSVPDTAALDAKLGDLQQRLEAKIDAGLAAQPTPNLAALETLQDEVIALKTKLGALAEAKLDAQESDLAPELNALDQRIAKLEAALPDLSKAIDRSVASAKSGAAAIAFANLRDAVSAGRPYAPELAAIRSLGPETIDLGDLPNHAETGIPTVPELVRALQRTAEASRAAPPANAGQSFLDGVIASARSAVTIRRIDPELTADTPDAVMARAGAQLNQGELDAAVKEIESLPPASREAFSSWLDDAHARASADETLSKLESALLASLGGETGVAKP